MNKKMKCIINGDEIKMVKFVYILIEVGDDIRVIGVYTSYEMAQLDWNCDSRMASRYIKGPIQIIEDDSKLSDEEMFNVCKGPMFAPFGDCIYR